MRMLAKIVKVLVCVALAVLVFGWVTKELWNWLVPTIFGLRAITFWQSVGLVVLGKLLFGGFHKHGHGHSYGKRRAWKRKMKARWEAMTPEERERFRSGMKSRWSCGDFGREDVPMEQGSR
jgi:hypothetical protein